MTNLTAAVEKNESGVFSFHLYKDFDQEAGKEQLVLVEKYVCLRSSSIPQPSLDAHLWVLLRYKDKAAYDLHAEMPEFQAMHKSFKDENLMAAPIIIKSVKPLVGFER